ncbi:MAG: phosphoenolpyruvate carboxylase [Solirubrobacterales bacterium]
MAESRPGIAAPSNDDGAMLGARSLEQDQALLTEVLSEVVAASEGEAAGELHARAVELAQRARDGDEAAPDELRDLVHGLSPRMTELLVRSLTRWFQLINLAEDNDRVRRLRARQAASRPSPRSGSLREAVARLAEHAGDSTALADLLASVEIDLVMTAHPTEARRRTIIAKQSRVFHLLRDLDERPGLPADDAVVRRRLAATIHELWGSDELRAVFPTVLDEVRTGLAYFNSTLGDVLPVVYRDVESAVAELHPDSGVEVPSFLRMGSWIGGDRDGNPFVTPEVTIDALELMRDQCLHFLERRVSLLAERASFADQFGHRAEALLPLLVANFDRFPELAHDLEQRNPREPYRRVFSLLRRRIEATRLDEETGYDNSDELLADLKLIRECLLVDRGELAAGGDIHDVIRQVEVFGFHFATVDIRQHARRHRSAIGEVLAVLGIEDDYVGLSTDQRCAILRREIGDRRPLVPQDISKFTAETQETIATFRMIESAIEGRHKGAIESYIISGAEGPDDVLEVLLMMKESTMSRAGGFEAELRIVPLFESGASLQSAPQTMRSLLQMPEYRAALEAVGNIQEVMVGYSDSNKDVGYLASSWGAYSSQLAMVEVFREFDVSWLFFHGRGGVVGRGGGPTNRAILSLPPGAVDGRLKTTEQGEVMASKYAVEEVAHRELELAAGATLVSMTQRAHDRATVDDKEFFKVIGRMAEMSAAAYRGLVYEDPDFVECFMAVTPVDQISRMQLGSRPARRSSDGGIADLRAIPWVFSWTQSRVILPAWFGLGSALAEARDEFGEGVLRRMRDEWPFFEALVSNAEMACAKADMSIARRYFELWDAEEPRERIWHAIESEFERTCDELIRLRGGERLLDAAPILQASIDRRNPYVDPLSYIQIELLRQLRGSGDAEPELDAQGELIGRLSLLTVNGIAGGLRNTG